MKPDFVKPLVESTTTPSTPTAKQPDRVLKMSNGRVITFSPPNSLAYDPSILPALRSEMKVISAEVRRLADMYKQTEGASASDRTQALNKATTAAEKEIEIGEELRLQKLLSDIMNATLQ
jgi:hypothetical protein